MEPTSINLSTAVRAAANQHAINRGIVPTGGPIFHEVAEAYEAGYAAGFITRPQPQHFPLAGQREFLQVFGPYLPYGIDVYHPHTGRYGKLKGLPYCADYDGSPLADVEFYCDQLAREAGGGDITEPVGKVLPVLYGFEDLATELLLPDGRRVVPAVEVAKLRGGHDNIDGVEVSKSGMGNTILTLTASGKTMWSDWQHDFQNGTIGYDLPRIDWLRAAHFAVGLAAHQYHRRQPGFDYASGEKPSNKKECGNCAGLGCAPCHGSGKEVGRA